MQCLKECCLRARLRIDQISTNWPKQAPSSCRKCCRRSLAAILFVPFVYLLFTAALRRFLFVCFYSSKLVGGGASTCWSYYSVRNVLATPKQKQQTPTRMLLLLFMLFCRICAVCVRAADNKHIHILREKENSVGVYFGLSFKQSGHALLWLFAFVSYVLCSCLSQRLRCGRVFWAAVGGVGSALCQVILFFNFSHRFIFW